VKTYWNIKIKISLFFVGNICDYIHCENDGVCQKAENSTIGYKCRCQFGFTGPLCEDRVNITSKKKIKFVFKIDYFIVACVKNPCQNKGNCTITTDRLVKCTCLKQYTGAFCEISI
jgi:hypothetical protein